MIKTQKNGNDKLKKDNSLNKLFRLDGKTVVLTGAAGRLGSRFAHILCESGSNLILVDKDAKKNSKLKLELSKKYNTICEVFDIDITNETSVKEMVQKITKKFKKIDVLINNAHFIPRDHPKRDFPFEEYPLDLWNETVNINLSGLFLCSREIGRIMVKQNQGVIINISSIYGITGADQRIYGKSRLNSPAFYATTKGGMVNLTKYLAAYWHGKNIRVNTLTLGGVFDEQLHQDKKFVSNYSKKTILGRMANKEDYDGALLFLASDASSYVTGFNLVVDGGWTAW
ncbi:MAG: short-chain dehydrogenase [Thaumarchaeota archaeon]|nr:MAG: short-chain dehydrogenase [Nitrososphaerota archaeon]